MVHLYCCICFLSFCPLSMLVTYHLSISFVFTVTTRFLPFFLSIVGLVSSLSVRRIYQSMELGLARFLSSFVALVHAYPIRIAVSFSCPLAHPVRPITPMSPRSIDVSPPLYLLCSCPFRPHPFWMLMTLLDHSLFLSFSSPCLFESVPVCLSICSENMEHNMTKCLLFDV